MSDASQNVLSTVVQFTRSGARRAGDDYQDIVAIGFFLDWLEKPDAFVSMTVEDEESGVLDDIRKERSDGVVELVQVKFATAPDDPDSEWEWDTLLNERDSKRSPGKKLPSLLARWAQSFFDVQAGGKKVEAFVLTNRLPMTELGTAIQNERLSLNRISKKTIRSEIIRQLGGEAKAVEFFAATRFQFNQPGLDTLQARYEQRFHRRGGEQLGWLNLKDELRHWVRDKNRPSAGGIIVDGLRGPRTVANWFSPKKCNVEVRENAILTTHQEKVIGRWIDWTDGLTEHTTQHAPQRSGEVFLVNRRWFEELCKYYQGHLVWGCEITVFEIDDRRDAPKNFSICKTFGGSRIIV
jgi:hypothetical protein